MDWSPSYKLYASDGLTLVYTFQYVQNDNGPQDPLKFTEIKGIRGQGSIIIAGSDDSWDSKLQFILIGKNYQDLIAQMNALQSTIVKKTPYILKVDLTPSTTQDYNVMRVMPIDWEPSQRFYSQKGTISFKVNSW